MRLTLQLLPLLLLLLFLPLSLLHQFTVLEVLLLRGVPQLKVPGKNIVISNSADILRYLYGDNCTVEEREAFLRPTARSLELEKKFERLGEDYRRFAYFHIFSSPVKEEWEKQVWGLYQPHIPT